MKVHCKFDKMVAVEDLVPHKKNRNQHSDEQITRLAELLAYQGIRAPIVVSTLSNRIVKGHGTLSAIKENEWTEAPVVFQPFDSDEQEYAFIISDNGISDWASLDMAGVNFDVGDLGPNFHVDLLGIDGFEIEPADRPEKKKKTQVCIHCGENPRE